MSLRSAPLPVLPRSISTFLQSDNALKRVHKAVGSPDKR